MKLRIVLIIFFAGWSTAQECFVDPPGNNDVVMLREKVRAQLGEDSTAKSCLSLEPYVSLEFVGSFGSDPGLDSFKAGCEQKSFRDAIKSVLAFPGAVSHFRNQTWIVFPAAYAASLKVPDGDGYFAYTLRKGIRLYSSASVYSNFIVVSSCTRLRVLQRRLEDGWIGVEYKDNLFFVASNSVWVEGDWRVGFRRELIGWKLAFAVRGD